MSFRPFNFVNKRLAQSAYAIAASETQADYNDIAARRTADHLAHGQPIVCVPSMFLNRDVLPINCIDGDVAHVTWSQMLEASRCTHQVK